MRYVTYWTDASGRADVEQARAADRAGEFHPAGGRTAFGIDKTPYWFRLDLRRPAGAPDVWWVELPHPGLDDVQVYVPGPAGYLKLYEVGDRQAFENRPIQHRHYIFPVAVPAEQTVTLYFRVQTNDTLVVPLHVWNPERFDEADAVDDMMIGLYYGVIIAMMVYNFFLLIKLRDLDYLYYLMFSLSVLAVVAELNGHTFQYLFARDLWWADRQHILFPILALSLPLLFTRRFLDLKTNLPRVDKVVLGTIGFEAVVGVIGMGFDYSAGQKLILILSPIVMAIMLMASIFRLRQGYRPALYFAVAEIPLQIGVVFSGLGGMGLISSEVLMEQAMRVGASLEVLLFSLALADRVALVHQEKEAMAARLEVHEKLAALEQESRTILEHTPDTVARYDRDFRRIYVNPAFGALAEGGPATLLGRTPSEYPGGAHAAVYEAELRRAFETGENGQFELKWPGKDGREICSHIRLTPERDLSGVVTSVLAVGRDITELNEYQAELQRKELAKSRFLAAAGHDLRQPLAAANLFVDALRMTSPTLRQEEIIERLDQSMTTFNGLLDSLLNISKLDAGVVKPEYAPVDVRGVFASLEQNFAPVARARDLDFRLFFPLRQALIVRSDAGLVRSVLMNLVSNAINYTSHGTVLISVRRRGARALFQVWDTGIGIPEEHIGKIFDEFYQVNNPQRDRTRGLGLGLSIARRALTLLGGEITCRSEPGRGTVFSFSLPLDGARARVPAISAPPREQDTAKSFAQGKRFVVVEDDVLVGQALSGLLRGIGGEVDCFDNAEDALRHEGIECADYVISDYMLAGSLNGMQFLNRLRQKCGKPINAVLITGDTSPGFLMETTDCAWPVLHKPVGLSALIASLPDAAPIG